MTATTYRLTDIELDVLLAALDDHRDCLEDEIFRYDAGSDWLRAELDRAIELYERVIHATTITINTEANK